MTGSSWGAFEVAAPEFASAGRRLWVGDDGAAIGFLSSVSVEGTPHLSPVCPIFAESGLYLSAVGRTPKRSDLLGDGRFVLHAFLGENDEEFQVAGAARLVAEAEERASVHRAIPFPSFDAEDPIFELAISRCLWCWWEDVGQPSTRPIRRQWKAA
jgi:hypothetical protein